MGSLFGKDPPPPKPPAPMPDQDDELTRRARRNQAMANRDNNTGLASTRLAQQPGTLGREYTRPTLGAG